MTTQYYIGVDAGGSKCRGRLEAADGIVLGRVETGPATIRRGADFAAASIIACIDETISAAGLGKADLNHTHIVVGAAGTESSVETDVLIEKLRSEYGRTLSLVSDAKTACAGAHDGEGGGIIIVGTGSIGYALVEGEPIRVGGYGFPVSDLGSGAHIGLAVVQHALASNGSGRRPTAFETAVLDQVGTSLSQIANWTSNATATDYAGFAPLVVAHAGNQDPAAIDILETAAAHIGDLISALNARGATRLSLMGGLASIIAPLLAPTLQKLLSPPRGDAIDGAILLARGPQKQQS